MILESLTAIENRLIATLQANPDLYDPSNPDTTKRGLTSISQVAAWRNFLNTIATEIFILQQLAGIFETEVEGLVNISAPETSQWVKDRTLKFQYDATTPQVVQVNADLSVSYPNINEALRIIAQCSVSVGGSGTIIIKVATGSPLAPLSGPEITALTSYLNTILGSDIHFKIINVPADTLKMVANIYYNGQYNGVIQANVIAALNTYLTSLGFNGVIKVSDIVNVVRNVTGVTDISISQLTAQPDVSTALPAINLILASTEITREYQTYAGYVVNSNSPNDFASTLTFLIDNN